MEIENSCIDDIDIIFNLYRVASSYMKSKGSVYYPEFDREMVEKEIEENKQWKLLVGDKVVCIWATNFSDPQIWEERNEDAAVYIHRIATHPEFRGRNFVVDIVRWAKQYAKENKKDFIRLDTVGNNVKLIEHYKKCGFDFLGLSELTNTDGLPAHYHLSSVSLFELPIDKAE